MWYHGNYNHYNVHSIIQSILYSHLKLIRFTAMKILQKCRHVQTHTHRPCLINMHSAKTMCYIDALTQILSV